jgi:hypothetical protein
MKLEMGWAARPIAEQFPELKSKDAGHFQKDSESISRLKMRGLLTDSEHRAITRRFAKSVAEALQ